MSLLLFYTDELVMDNELSPPRQPSDGKLQTERGFIPPDSFGTRRGTQRG